MEGNELAHDPMMSVYTWETAGWRKTRDNAPTLVQYWSNTVPVLDNVSFFVHLRK